MILILEDRVLVAHLASEPLGLHKVRGPRPIDPDAVVAKIKMGAQRGEEGPVLGSGQLPFEHAALNPVKVLAAGLEDERVAFGRGVVDEDDEHGSPPGPEGLVRRALQAEADNLEGFEMNDLLVGDLAA